MNRRVSIQNLIRFLKIADDGSSISEAANVQDYNATINNELKKIAKTIVEKNGKSTGNQEEKINKKYEQLKSVCFKKEQKAITLIKNKTDNLKPIVTVLQHYDNKLKRIASHLQTSVNHLSDLVFKGNKETHEILNPAEEAVLNDNLTKLQEDLNTLFTITQDVDHVVINHIKSLEEYILQVKRFVDDGGILQSVNSKTSQPAESIESDHTKLLKQLNITTPESLIDPKRKSVVLEAKLPGISIHSDYRGDIETFNNDYGSFVDSVSAGLNSISEKLQGTAEFENLQKFLDVLKSKKDLSDKINLVFSHKSQEFIKRIISKNDKVQGVNDESLDALNVVISEISKQWDKLSEYENLQLPIDKSNVAEKNKNQIIKDMPIVTIVVNWSVLNKYFETKYMIHVNEEKKKKEIVLNVKTKSTIDAQATEEMLLQLRDFITNELENKNYEFVAINTDLSKYILKQRSEKKETASTAAYVLFLNEKSENNFIKKFQSYINKNVIDKVPTEDQIKKRKYDKFVSDFIKTFAKTNKQYEMNTNLTVASVDTFPVKLSIGEKQYLAKRIYFNLDTDRLNREVASVKESIKAISDVLTSAQFKEDTSAPGLFVADAYYNYADRAFPILNSEIIPNIINEITNLNSHVLGLTTRKP